MEVIVVNSGSSSIKYEAFDLDGLSAAAKGLLERIGEPDSKLKHRWLSPSGRWEEIVETRRVADHREGFSFILEVSRRAREGSALPEIFAVGHRVVHGGEKFKEPAVVDDAVLAAIEELIPLAPLHNPANVTGIKVMGELLPDVPQVAVFDTAFHQTIPARAYHYALPAEFYEKHHVRKYGFHGSSHGYVAKEAVRHLGKPLSELNLIILHLGNGASAAAIQGGRSIDTSMGMTPLEGLVMGTRCGDIDPAIPFYLMRQTGMKPEDVENLMNRESGLKGICGVSDMREILGQAAKGNQRAALVIDTFCYRIKKYIGAYYAVLGRLDAIVFTGGIGENADAIRQQVCEGLQHFGITVDPEKNNAVKGNVAEIQQDGLPMRVLVIRTNEEREIALQTIRTIEKAKGVRVKQQISNTK